MKVLFEERFGGTAVSFGIAEFENEKKTVQSQRLRTYKEQRYCSPELNNDLDEYDNGSIYFIAKIRSPDQIIGSARFIKGNSNLLFPIQKAFEFDNPVKNISVLNSAEIGKVVSVGSENNNLGKLTITLGLITSIAIYSNENGFKLGYSFIKKRLFDSLVYLGLPLYPIQNFRLKYPKNGTLSNYFYNHGDGVVPAYYFTDQMLRSARYALYKVNKYKLKIQRQFNSDFWAKYFDVYDVLNMVFPYLDLMHSLEEELDIQKDDIILDVGSGTGNFIIGVQSKCKKIVGIDNSAEGTSIHKNKDQNAEIVIADITKGLPFPDNYFTKAVSNNTIYTLSNKDQFKVIREIHRVLQKNGKFVISNVRLNFSPFKIYRIHIKESIYRIGIFRTILLLFKMIIPTVKMFYYNAKIKKAGILGKYYFLGEEEQDQLLVDAGFKKVSSAKYVYAGQGIMHSAVK